MVIIYLESKIQMKMARFQLGTYIKCITKSFVILHASHVQDLNKMNVLNVTLEHQRTMFVRHVHQINTMLKMLGVD